VICCLIHARLHPRAELGKLIKNLCTTTASPSHAAYLRFRALVVEVRHLVPARQHGNSFPACRNDTERGISTALQQSSLLVSGVYHSSGGRRHQSTVGLSAIRETSPRLTWRYVSKHSREGLRRSEGRPLAFRFIHKMQIISRRLDRLYEGLRCFCCFCRNYQQAAFPQPQKSWPEDGFERQITAKHRCSVVVLVAIITI
jgi:hypothetical protein